MLEGSKLFFWESTQIGFVAYPPGLAGVFRWAPFKNGVRFLLALLTVLGFMHLAANLWHSRKSLLVPAGPASATGALVPLVVFFPVSAFISVYALFSILARYALPIAPLFLITIAFGINARLRKR